MSNKEIVFKCPTHGYPENACPICQQQSKGIFQQIVESRPEDYIPMDIITLDHFTERYNEMVNTRFNKLLREVNTNIQSDNK